jgi:DNA-damage-inducible protein D
LQKIPGYTEWRNFIKVIDKAKDAAVNAGEKLIGHFVDVNKMVEFGNKAKKNWMILPSPFLTVT